MIRKTILAVLALLAACSEQPQDPGKADGFAFETAVAPAAGGRLQRVVLPPAALAALRRSDSGDVRIFDAAGKPVALAIDDSFGSGAERKSTTVPTSPIAMPAIPGNAAVRVRVDQPEQSVTVDAVNAEAEAESHPLAALLLDTRKLDDPAIELALDVALPPQRELALTIERSADLKAWEPLASQVLFRFDGNPGGAAETYRIALPGTPLKDSYLRVSWQLSSDVAVRGVQVVTMHRLPPPPVAMPAIGAQLGDPHTLAFRLPAGLPVASLRLTGSGKDGVIPLGLEARSGPEAPWNAVAAGVLRDGQSLTLGLEGGQRDEYRLRADPRSAGFIAAPRIELLVGQMGLLAAFNGNGPYKLAVGNIGAAPTYFDAGQLRGTLSAEAALPLANVADAPAPPLSLGTPQPDGPFTPKKIALWAALLLATAVLALAAIRLMSAGNSTPNGEQS